LQAIRERVEALASATAQKNVLARIPVALPPELEQKQISDEVDALLFVEEQFDVASSQCWFEPRNFAKQS
jgi:hypothetical protein